MSLDFKVQINIPDDIKNLAQQFPKVGAAVLNRLAKESVTVIVKETAAKFNVKPSMIRDRLKIVRATASSLRAVLNIGRKKFRMLDFVVSGKIPTARKGVSPKEQQAVVVEIIKGKRTTLLESPFAGGSSGGKAFISRGKSGNLEVRRRTTSTQYPITLWKYVSAGVIINIKKLTPVVQELINKKLPQELPRTIEGWYKAGRDVR